MWTIDHVFVFARPQAPEQRRIVAAGLVPGAQRAHAGQGTENVCFGFASAYLELLWLADERAASDRVVKPLGLHERARWRETGASPFGVCLRPERPGEDPPFPHWDYRPPYLPADAVIRMGCNSGVVGEPILFAIDRPGAQPGGGHALAHRALAGVVVETPDLAPMSLLRDVRVAGLELREGAAHHMELTFAQGDGPPAELDLRPDLPLVLRW